MNKGREVQLINMVKQRSLFNLRYSGYVITTVTASEFKAQFLSHSLDYQFETSSTYPQLQPCVRTAINT